MFSILPRQTPPCPLGRTHAWLNITDSYLGIVASLPVFPQPSPSLSLTHYSSLFSPLSGEAGSKNSSELNSHNNMRLSGDRRTVLDSTEAATAASPDCWLPESAVTEAATMWICLCVFSWSRSFCPPPLLSFPCSIHFTYREPEPRNQSLQVKASQNLIVLCKESDFGRFCHGKLGCRFNFWPLVTLG